MSLEDRKRRNQAILDSAPRAVQRSNPAYESEPPPIPSTYPPVVPGIGSPSVARRDPLPHAERVARWIKVLAAIATGCVVLYGLFGAPVVNWFKSRASDVDLKQNSEAAAAAVKTATDPLLQRISELEKKEKRNGQRWNQLDLWHEQRRRPNTTPLRKFGPEAERRGEARYDDGSDPE